MYIMFMYVNIKRYMVTLGEPGAPWRWLGVKKWQLSLWDTSHSTKCQQQAAVGYWVSLCVCSVRLIVYQLGILSLSQYSQYSQTIVMYYESDHIRILMRVR